MKRGKSLIVALLVLPLLSSLTFANGLNLNGMGARASAMGGAYVALANDFTALFWNPAGMAQLSKMTFGFYGTDILPKGGYVLAPVVAPVGTIPLVNTQTLDKHYFAGMAAYYHPISDNVIFGVGVYTPSGLGANWDGEDLMLISEETKYNWMTKIGVVTIAPGIAFRLSDYLYIGAAANIHYGMFDIKAHAGADNWPPPPLTPLLRYDLGQREMSLKGWGYGATVGIILKPMNMLSIGATFRTSFKIKFSGDAIIDKLDVLSTLPGHPLFGLSIPNTSEMSGEVTWPMWIAGGIALRPFENLTITADAQYTNWKKIDVIEFDFTDQIWKQIMEASGKNKMPMHWADATQLRVGAEYLINSSFAIRGGYYKDPAPAPLTTMNILVPNYDFDAFSLGFGFALGAVKIDFAVEYLKGKDRNVPFETEITSLDPFKFDIIMPEGYEQAMPGKHTLKIWAPNISISINL